MTSHSIEPRDIPSHSSPGIYLPSIYLCEESKGDQMPSFSNTSYCEESNSSLASSVPAETSSRTKILLLRKQLEENRIKFEKQKRENAEKRAEMEEMNGRIEKLRSDILERDNVIHSLKDSDVILKFNPDIQHLYHQIVCKDNSILALSDKVLLLENTIEAQKEELAEKDEIIKARKEAISIICKDKDEKLVKTNYDIDDLRQKINLLQSQFNNERAKWNEKELSFEGLVKEKNKKISILEENYQRIESIRFELSVRNGELQEKIVSQQSEIQDLRAELAVSKTQLQNKLKEISSLNKKVLKAETFGQKKLRNIEKYVKEFIKESDLSDKFLQLQNSITELEEENGTLQLKLVDSDETISLNNQLTQSLSKAENKIEKLNLEVLSYISSLSQKENEHIGLMEQTNHISIQLGDLKQTNDALQNEIDNLRQLNISLELKLCEIEEERDNALKNLSLENKEINDSNIIEPNEYNEVDKINKLKLELEQMAASLSSLEEVISEKENLLESVLKEKEEKYFENESLVSFLAEKEELILSQNHKIEKYESSIASLENTLEIRKLDAKNLVDNVNTLQNEIKCLKNNLHDSDIVVSRLNGEVKKFEKEVLANIQSLSILRKSEDDLKSTVQEKENIIENLHKEINNLRSDLNCKNSNLIELRDRIGTLEASLHSKEKIILNLESDIADKLNENSQQASMSDKFKHEIENMKSYNQQIKIKLEEELNLKSSILLRRETEIEELQDQILIMSKSLDNSNVIASKNEEEIRNKNFLYESLLTQNKEFEAKVKDLEDKIAEMNSELSNVGKLQSLLSERTQNFQELAEVHKHLAEKHSHLELQLKVIEVENINITKQLQVKEEENENLSRDYCSFIQTKGDEVTLQNTLLSEKERELKSLLETRDQSFIELKQSLELLNTELLEKNRDIANLKSEMDLMNHKFEQSNNDIESAKQTLSLKESDIASYISDIEWYKTKYDEALSSLQVLQEKMDMQSQLENVDVYDDGSPITAEDSTSRDVTVQSNSLVRLESTSGKLSGKSTLLSSSHKEQEIPTVNLLTENDEYMGNSQELEHKIFNQVIDEDMDSNLAIGKNCLSLRDVQSNIENSVSNKCEDEFINVKQGLEESGILCSQLEPENEELDSETTKLYPSNLFTAYSSLNCEVVSLRKELMEAHEAIARLETSLATQASIKSDLRHDNSEEWGVVDLGKSPVHSISSMIENSLNEKNKTLSVIQEQLKNALEDINTATNEKKVLIHKVSVLESTVIDKDNNISALQQQILDLNINIQDLNCKLDKLQSLIKDSEKSDLYSKSVVPSDSCFEASLTTDLTCKNQGGSLPAESDFSKFSTEISKQKYSPSDPLMEEVHFKLSWYEENWPALTMHYNLLKANYQVAEEQISRLNENLRKYNFNNGHEFLQLQGSSVVDRDFQVDENKLEIAHIDRNEAEVSKIQDQVEDLQLEGTIYEKTGSEKEVRSMSIEALIEVPQTRVEELDLKSRNSLQDLKLFPDSVESENVLNLDVKDISCKIVEEHVSDRSHPSIVIENLKGETKSHMYEKTCIGESIEELENKIVVDASLTHQSDFYPDRSGAQLSQELRSFIAENEYIHNVDVLKTNSERSTVPEFSVQNLQSIIAANKNLKNEIQKLKDNCTAVNSENINLINESQGLQEINVLIKNEVRSLKSQLDSLIEENSNLKYKIASLQEKLNEGEMYHHAGETIVTTGDDHKGIKCGDGNIDISSSKIMEADLSQLKCKLISVEESKLEIMKELQLSKVENGKLIKKLKLSNSKNESLMQTLEAKSSSLLNMEEEMRLQVQKILSERNELKQKLDEVGKEKIILKGRVDTFEERHSEQKKLQEDSDHEISFVQAEELRREISNLEYEKENVEIESAKLKQLNDDIISELKKVSEENENLKSVIDDTQCAQSKFESDVSAYKKNFLELHTAHENLKEEYNSLQIEFSKLQSDHVTLKSAYDVLYGDYHNLQEDKDSIRLELGVTCGERDKFMEEIKSLNNQLSALQEEEEVDVVKALQNECSSLREENSNIKDEICEMTEVLRQREEEVERIKNSLKQQIDIQHMLRDELVSKSMENDNLNSDSVKKENELKYLKADVASIKSKYFQTQLELQKSNSELSDLKTDLSVISPSDELRTEQMQVTDDGKMSKKSIALIMDGDKINRSPSDFLSYDSSTFIYSLQLRCKQLSLEISKLLEERDGLQLKLSSSLRENHDLVRELTLSPQLPSPLTPSQYLNQKLCELKDFNDDYEQRVIGDLESSNLSTVGYNLQEPTLPSFLSRTAPVTPTTTIKISADSSRKEDTSLTLMEWLLGKKVGKEVLHI